MRLIDADALILKEDLVGDAEFIGLNKIVFVGRRGSKNLAMMKTAFKTMIDNAPTIDPNKWISVEDRLPETEGDYLVWNREQRRIEKRFFYRLPPNYPVESYPEIREYFGNYRDYKRITHWMLLPEPPKMKGE